MKCFVREDNFRLSLAKGEGRVRVEELVSRIATNPLTSILSPLEEERRTDRNAMKVRAQFYAQLRDLVGSREMDVDLAEGATVGDLLDQIYAQQPKLRPHDKSILIGAGVEFVDRDYKLKPGDEISIMPPVQGG